METTISSSNSSDSMFTARTSSSSSLFGEMADFHNSDLETMMTQDEVQSELHLVLAARTETGGVGVNVGAAKVAKSELQALCLTKEKEWETTNPKPSR